MTAPPSLSVLELFVPIADIAWADTFIAEREGWALTDCWACWIAVGGELVYGFKYRLRPTSLC